MKKLEFNKVVKASGKNFKVVETGSGSEKHYALYEGGELVYGDSANEDLCDYEKALHIFAQSISEDYIHYNLREVNERNEWALKPTIKVKGIKKAVSALKTYKCGKLYLNKAKGQLEAIEVVSVNDYGLSSPELVLVGTFNCTHPASIRSVRYLLEDVAERLIEEVIVTF